MEGTEFDKLSDQSFKRQEIQDIVFLVIDMQYDITAEGYGVLKNAEELGVRRGYDYYYERIQNTVIPNIQRLLNKFREIGETVIFTKIRSEPEKNEGQAADPERQFNKEGMVLKELEPMKKEIVLTKNGPEIFEDTNLDTLLKNGGIETMIVAGVLTNECVETAVIEAVKRDYTVIVVKDATAAFSQDLQESSLESIGENSIRIVSTEDIIESIDKVK